MTPTDLHRIWRREADRVATACTSTDPPAVPRPPGSDPWAELDASLGNRALEAGYPVRSVAEVIAARALARSFGRSAIRVAVLVGAPRHEPQRQRGPRFRANHSRVG